MKTSFFLVALMFSTPALARIGETTEQLHKRYGRPLEIIRDDLERRRYSFRGFIVLVGLDQGISQCEVYRKEDNARMTETEIQGLLQANAGNSEWRREPEESVNSYVYWSRDKRTRVAIYTLAAHSLIITSKAFLPRFAHLVNSGGRRKLEGF